MKKRFLLSALLLLGLSTGCGNDAQIANHAAGSSPSSGTTSSANAPTNQLVVEDFAGRQIAFADVPQRIVALSNGDVDIIYALGGEVVGRPTTRGSAPHPDAEKAEQIGNTHEVDLEKITLLRPDVVLGNYPLNQKDIPAIEGVGSQLLLTNANSVDDIKKQIRLFGTMLQKEDKANELIQSIDAKLSEYQGSSTAAKPRALLVYGAPGTYMAALSNSLSGNILELAGGENIAADYPALEQYPQYAQLNTERIVEANPQAILIITHGNPEEVRSGFLKEMQENAAWNSLDAVKNDRVEVLPSDLFGTNPGTRVTEAMDLMSEYLGEVK
ncbi:ABC transporter substrate-binding protein [Brevibacillus sp. TJ4]|uniref:ABC transporter substrate-binding protein n=1 Tax=Brevibacillus sp. TJ4 TaxID=3234853 RepID=UPI003B9E7077